MGSQDNEKVKNTIDGISNAISGDGRKFVAELKNFLRKFSGHIDEVVKDVVTDVGEGTAEQLTDLSLLEVNVTGSNGSPQNNIQVDFSNVNVTNYRQTQIWMKTGSNDFAQVGVTSGLRYIVENVKAGTTYTIKVIAVNKNGGTSKFDEAPQKSITIKGSVLIPDAPRQFYLTWDEDGALWEWQYEDNGYVDFFELRLDANAGSYDENLLDRTRNTYSRVSPPVRSGTAYLFVRNVFGTYSQPAIHVFNKALPLKPNPPSVVPTLDGMVITMDALPSDYQGWILDIDGEEFKVYNKQFTYYQFSGEITVKYCFFDSIGRSEWSDSVTAKAKVTIDKEQLPEISYDEFDQAIKDAIDSANNQVNINQELQSSVENVLKDVGELNSTIGGIKDDVQDISQSFEGIEAGIQQNANSITSLFASTQALDSKIESNKSLIQQTANSIETTVVEKVAVAKTEVVREVLDEIDDDLVAEVQKEVGSQVKQEAENITATVYEMVKDEVTAEAVAQVKIEADKIKSTVYEKTEVDGLLGNKANKDDVYTKAETSSQITQTASEITYLVYNEIADAEERMSADATSKVSQSAEEIKALVNKEVTSLDGKISSNTTQITANANGLETIAEAYISVLGVVDRHTTSISQNAKSITAVTTAVNTIDGKVNENTSAIKATSNSITSVVSELNKDADECKYSAITQLKNGIDLAVKNEDLDGVEIVSRINLSDDTVTIEGEHIHITGDTEFDNNVIVGGYIASNTIDTDHLKTNSVTTAKIQANAITADKIKAGAITVDKITDKSITSTKIEDGAITTTKIVDGAVSTTKIEGGAITADKIKAGSIIGEHISAGAVSADKLYAGDINMSGALALVGGAVRLDKNGLKVTRNNGSYTVFDGVGINYYDKNGTKFATVSRMMVGIAKHNDYVRFDSPWDIVPSVIVIPMTIKTGVENYTTEQLSVNYYATDVSKNGFRVKAYTVVDTVRGLQTIMKMIAYNTTSATANGEYIVTDIPPSATQAKIKLEFYRIGRRGRDGGYSGVSAVIYVNNNIVDSFVYTSDFRTADNLTAGDMSSGSFSSTNIVTSIVPFNQGDEIKITAYARDISGSGYFARCSLETIEYDSGDEEIIATGAASFIVSDSISSAYSIERGI